MAKLPAYGRELLALRNQGLIPAPIAQGSPGAVVVTDLWDIAFAMRKRRRTALVVEPAVSYDWRVIRGLVVFIFVLMRPRDVFVAIQRERPHDAILFSTPSVQAFRARVIESGA